MCIEMTSQAQDMWSVANEGVLFCPHKNRWTSSFTSTTRRGLTRLTLDCISLAPRCALLLHPSLTNGTASCHVSFADVSHIAKLRWCADCVKHSHLRITSSSWESTQPVDCKERSLLHPTLKQWMLFHRLLMHMLLRTSTVMGLTERKLFQFQLLNSEDGLLSILWEWKESGGESLSHPHH